MGDKSEIQWTDATWNPVTGCSKVSPGCAHCYAESLTQRFADTWGVPDLPWTPANAAANVRLHPERLDQPLRWRRPRMVFVNSMSDLFHEQVPDEFIAQVFSVMRRAPQHTFQVLTKRPERMREFVRRLAWKSAADPYLYPARADAHAEPFGPPFVCPNVWLGVSIENRRFVHRADLLRETPAAARFISAEPLLGPLVFNSDMGYVRDGIVDVPEHLQGDAYESCWLDGADLPELDLSGIAWLIVGGESGPQHRRIDPEWVRDLRDACERTDTAFFFKQWGGRTPKANGRELDGRIWDEFPTRKLEGAAK